MAGRRATRVLVVAARRLTAEALAAALGAQRGIVSAGAASSPEEALARCAGEAPDVVLVDVEIDAGRGLFVRRLLEAAPAVTVLALWDGGEEVGLARVMEAGAAGHVASSEPVAALADAVRRAAVGDELLPPDERRRLLRRLRHLRAQEATEEQRAGRLTRRELEILQLMADGTSRDGMETELGITRATLRTHTQNILTKLGVHSKTEALALAIRQGKVAPRPQR
jgi:DNA-binding NarL/FixJ family response regulator